MTQPRVQHLTLALALATTLGCQQEPAATHASQQLAPPPALTLQGPTQLSPGQAATFTVTGATALPDDLPVFFVFGGRGLGDGLCPDVLQGRCLDVAGAPARVERRETAAGEASLTLDLPPSLSIPSLTAQAVVLGPNEPLLTAAIEIPLGGATSGGDLPCGTTARLGAPETYDYIGDGATAHLLDVYRPVGGADNNPVLFWIHGGGWLGGDKQEAEDGVAFQAAQGLGYTLISINYSYSTEASYTQILGETKRALTWVKDNANNLGIDPARIVVAGDSAGGHLAAFLATSAGTYDLGATGDTSVAAALSIYGPQDFLLEEYTDSCGLEVELLYEFLDCNPNGALPSLACDADDLIASSPATYIDASDPPMMLVHGQQDCVVPWEQSAHMANLLEQAGVPVNLQLTPGGEHDVDTLNTSALDMARWIADQNGCPVP